jgi:hypothetical protein
MLECMSMDTPMEANLKLLVDTSPDLIDATLYRQIIGLPMYLTNTRPNICFAVKTLSQFLVEPRRVHLVNCKTCDEVPLKVQWIMVSAMMEIMTSH